MIKNQLKLWTKKIILKLTNNKAQYARAVSENSTVDMSQKSGFYN